MTSAEVLAALDDRKVKSTDVGKILGLDISAVSRLRSGTRRLQFDEGVTLIEHFGLDGSEPQPTPVRESIGGKLDRIIALLESTQSRT